jgi:uncharacterized protein YbaP (TraB family)
MKTNNLTRILALSLFVFFFQSTFVEAQDTKTLFWEVSGKKLKKPSYMFGTYHLLNDTYMKELPNAEKAFKKADGVVVEMLIDSTKLMSLSMMAMMQGTTFKELVDSVDYVNVKIEVAEKLGPQMAAALNMLKPNAIMAALIMNYNREYNAELLGKYPGTALDLYFANDAKSRKKEVIGLESMEDQFEVLYNRQPLEKQAETLVKLVNDKTEVMEMQKDLATFYLANDLDKLNAMYEEYSDKYGESDYLLKDRNIKWMDVFPDILKKGNQFIAVGALHLPGEFGMINLLRKAGYTVKPLSAK